MELVSVIIPTYNREKTILDSIKSVLSQSYPKLELIIVDDCSTDNTRDIINKIDDKRLKYFVLRENKGACYARNYGIEKAKGQLVAFQDSDDIWYPTKLEKQVNCLQQLDLSYGFVFCSFSRNYGEPKIVPPLSGESFSGNIYRKLITTNFISTQTILCRKSVLEEIGGFDDSLPALQDWDLVLRISKKYKVEHIKESLVEVKISEDSITHDFSKGIQAREALLGKYKNEFSKKEIKSWYFDFGLYAKQENQLIYAEKMFFKAIHFKSIKGIIALKKYIQFLIYNALISPFHFVS